MTEPIFDYDRLDGKQSLKDKNRAIDDESNRRGKSDMKRIVSMLTRMIQRTQRVAEGSIEYEYEYEYRDAEYEYELDRIAES